jgi:hypothetical protein
MPQVKTSSSLVLHMWQIETVLLGYNWQTEPRPKRGAIYVLRKEGAIYRHAAAVGWSSPRIERISRRKDSKSSEEFSEQRRRKRTVSDKEIVQSKKISIKRGTRNTRIQVQIPKRNFFTLPPLETRWSARTTKKSPAVLRTVNSRKYHQARQAGRQAGRLRLY